MHTIDLPEYFIDKQSYMIQQTNIKGFKTGNGTMHGAGFGNTTGRFLGSSGSAALLLCLLLVPMASFEQSSPGSSTRPVALHRLATRPLSVACCGWEATDLRPLADRRPTLRISLPGRHALALADDEMMRNHASPYRDLLPAMAPFSVERADTDIDILFHLSNATWVTEASMADADIDLWFRLENLFVPDAGQLEKADMELHGRFLAEVGCA